jgi:hypothetical protein
MDTLFSGFWLEELYQVATAGPRELMPVETETVAGICYGINDHGYQYTRRLSMGIS